jgi:hypothetical protein
VRRAGRYSRRMACVEPDTRPDKCTASSCSRRRLESNQIKSNQKTDKKVWLVVRGGGLPCFV